jgi:hypothetical protein
LSITDERRGEERAAAEPRGDCGPPLIALALFSAWIAR